MIRTPHGYHGRYLRIDVTDARAEWVELPERALRDFLGGSGLGAYLLLHEGQAAADPLAPEAPLAFVFSPLVGSPLTTSAKFAVASKSPLTERFNDSLASSHFALDGKKTGADAILLIGRAQVPSVLVIDDGRVRIDPAGSLWGKDCPATQEELRTRYGSGFSFAVIGPAGEQQVRYATISHDGRHAGRGGQGAVLGAKNIKALAVRGAQRTHWAHPDALVDYSRDLSKRSLGPATAKYRELGTVANLLVFNRLRALPTRNFQRGSFAAAESLAPEAISQKHRRVRASCAACTIGCEHLFEIDPKQPGDSVRLEYESLFALGSLCDIGDPRIVLQAAQRCDAWGLDTISAGGTIAFAMECQQRGLLDVDWLRFGDGEALLRAIEMIGTRTGVGALLAEGSRRMAEQIGGTASEFAAHVKGLEIPGYEPRAMQTMALGFAVGTRGADHNRSGAYEADFSPEVDRHRPDGQTAARAIESEDRAALMDSLIFCKFLRGVFGDLFEESAEILRMVTGWDADADEMRATAKRIVHARKWFNIQAGWQPGEDQLPARFFNQPLDDDDRATMDLQSFQQLVQQYNVSRDWTPEGWLPETLRQAYRLDF